MSEATTLGTRIQEGRKAAGLSQEALGEHLNVSRQAVSKWESDAAVPELDKLIAMSRLFACTIGELLGVEEAKAPDAPSGELTERELAAAEAIAAKYAAQVGRKPVWSRKKKGIAGAVCAIIAAAIIAGVCWGVHSVNRKFDDMQSQVNGIQGSVAGQIGSITAQFQTILDEQNDLLADKSVQITDFDWEKKTVTLSVTALPKESTATTTAVFTAKCADGQKLTAQAQNDNGHFSASHWVVPMSEELQISAVFTDGEASTSAVIDTVGAAEDNFSFKVYGGWSSSWNSSSDTISLGRMDLYIENDYGSLLTKPLELTAVDLCLFRNRNKSPEKTSPVEDAPELLKSAGVVDMSAMTGYETSVKLAEGDTVIATVRIRDNYGRTVYIPMDAWRLAGGDITTPQLPSTTYSDGSMMPAPWTPGTALN